MIDILNLTFINYMAELIKNMLFYFRDNWLALAAFLVSIVSLLITVIKNLNDRQYAKDKELLEQLKTSMELAFHSIAAEKDSNYFPVNNRLNWLASARHIIRYRQLKEFLKTRFYITLCDEQEEYWRNNFYKLLAKIGDSKFFEYINPDEMEEETIEPRSAAIIYSFSIWKEGMSDPIESMSFEDIVHKYKLFSPINRHFRDFIKRKYPGLAKTQMNIENHDFTG